MLLAANDGDRLRSDFQVLLDDVRRAKPTEGSVEETALLTRLIEFSLSALRALGPSVPALFREGVDAGLLDVIKQEAATTEVERKLALRYIETAANTFGTLMEFFVRHGPPPMLEPEAISWLAQLDPAVLLDADDRVLFQFQLDFFAAMESLAAPLEELAFWAQRSLVTSRRVELIIRAQSVGLRGEIARLRSRYAWLAWDREEVEREFAPWPRRRSSP